MISDRVSDVLKVWSNGCASDTYCILIHVVLEWKYNINDIIRSMIKSIFSRVRHMHFVINYCSGTQPVTGLFETSGFFL